MLKPLFSLPLCLFLFLPAAAGAISSTIAGFGDSLTCTTCNDGSYLSLLENYLPDVPILDDRGVSATTSSQISDRLVNWFNDGYTADLLILMAGTVDTYRPASGFGAYDPLDTLSNLTYMVDLVMGEGIPLLLLAPPPVDPGVCNDPIGISCGTVNARLSDLASELQLLAGSLSVPFVNLHDLFNSDPRIGETPGTPNSLFRHDGLHLLYETGDTLIASTISPLVEELLNGGNGGPSTPPAPVPEPTSPVLFSISLLIGSWALRSRPRVRTA